MKGLKKKHQKISIEFQVVFVIWNHFAFFLCVFFVLLCFFHCSGFFLSFLKKKSHFLAFHFGLVTWVFSRNQSLIEKRGLTLIWIVLFQWYESLIGFECFALLVSHCLCFLLCFSVVCVEFVVFTGVQALCFTTFFFHWVISFFFNFQNLQCQWNGGVKEGFKSTLFWKSLKWDFH